MGTKVVTVSQPNRNRFRYTVIAAVILAIIGTLAIVRAFPQLFFRTAPAADDPILMAGGSLTVRGGAGGQFNVSGHDAVYTPAGGKLTRVDITYYDADGLPDFTSLPIGAADTVLFNYCASAGNCAALTARGNPSGHGLLIGPVDGDTIPRGANVFSHNPADGFIQGVVFSGTTFGCRNAAGLDGRCYVVLHYCRLCS